MGNRGSFDSLRSLRMTFFGREGQGQRGDAVGGVQVAEFAGHSSGCAVYLPRFREGLGPAHGGSLEGESAGHSLPKSGCYHRRSVNVL